MAALKPASLLIAVRRHLHAVASEEGDAEFTQFIEVGGKSPAEGGCMQCAGAAPLASARRNPAFWEPHDPAARGARSCSSPCSPTLARESFCCGTHGCTCGLGRAEGNSSAQPAAADAAALNQNLRAAGQPAAPPVH
jgi:hypothetical protein